ncbi:MAG: GtrA family protein [Oscillospiraceae bacterium]|nr:GtrA family protein [Oscillospiraceae bacterium]
MIEKVKALCVRNREILVYLIVGVLTTVVAWTAKFLWNLIFYEGTAYPTGLQNSILSVVSWVSGVLFAYPTNRKWVFRSTNPDIFKEATGFVASRLATLVLEWLVNLILVSGLHVSIYVSTIIAAVLVVIGNYVFSKLLVFREKKS